MYGRADEPLLNLSDVVTSHECNVTTRKRLIRPWPLVPGIFWSGTNIAPRSF